jgi:hypothetical protein
MAARRSHRKAKRVPRKRDLAGARHARQVKAHVTSANRLGFRLSEFAAMVGISEVTLWRRIKAGEVATINLGGVTIVPMFEVQRLGLLKP